jgi:hypothetical protein
MKLAVVLLASVLPLARAWGQTEIEGYKMGWIGGQGRGTFVILSREGMVTVDKREQTRYLGKPGDTIHGARVIITIRPCEEEDYCVDRPRHWKGIAAVVRAAEQQRPEYLRAFEVVQTFLRGFWHPWSAPLESLFSERCLANQATHELIAKLMARAWASSAPDHRITPLQLEGLNAWAFTELGKDGAEVITDPLLFEPYTCLKLRLVFQGDKVLIDSVVEEPKSTYDRWLALVLR